MGLLDLAERKGAEGDFKEAENYYKVTIIITTTLCSCLQHVSIQLISEGVRRSCNTGGAANQAGSVGQRASAAGYAIGLAGPSLRHRQQTEESRAGLPRTTQTYFASLAALLLQFSKPNIIHFPFRYNYRKR
jgi:hypothetical protein